MEELKIEGNIKKIAVKNSDDEVVTVLRIDTADPGTAQRFARVVKNLEDIANAGSSLADTYREKYREYEGKDFDELEDSVKLDLIIDVSTVRIDVISKMAEELDACFGKGTVRNVFRENYELYAQNFPDDEFGYVPDEDALIEFVNRMIPTMNSLFETRNREIRKRYSPGRGKGKHNKTKNELISEYRKTHE